MTINKKLDHKKIWVDSMIGMTLGFVSTLIIGTVIGLLTIKQDHSFALFLKDIKNVLSFLSGFGIGIGIGIKSKLKPLQILAIGLAGIIVSQSMLKPSYFLSENRIDWTSAKIGLNINGITKGSPGDIFAPWVGSTLLIYLFKTFEWTWFFDILFVPFIGIVFGVISSLYLTYLTSTILVLIEWVIEHSANKVHWLAVLLSPVIGALMGLALSFPTSSAAIALALSLRGDAATAAIAGTSAQMISFGIITYWDTRKISKSLAVAFGSSMLQMPNFSRKPLLLIIPTIASSVAALIAVASLPLDFASNSPTTGMGTCALYGQIFTLEENGWDNYKAYLNIIFIQLLLPILLTLPLAYLFFKKSWIKKGDLELTHE